MTSGRRVMCGQEVDMTMKMTPPKQVTPDAEREVGSYCVGVLCKYRGWTSPADDRLSAVLSMETYAGSITYFSVHIERDDERWGAYSDDEFVAAVRAACSERFAALASL